MSIMITIQPDNETTRISTFDLDHNPHGSQADNTQTTEKYHADVRYKQIRLNCSKCGRFVGKGGFKDVFYDDYNGGWEIGYPLCERCLNKKAVTI